MTPDIYHYTSDLNNESKIPYKYGIVFRYDEDLDVHYPNGPFCFYVETNDPLDYDKLDFVLLGLRWDPIEIVAVYDGLELARVDTPAHITA